MNSTKDSFRLILEDELTGSRDGFNESWLTEMPMGIGQFETYDQLVYNIREKVKLGGLKVEVLPNGLHKLVGSQIVHYWREANGDIAIGAELERKHQTLVVRISGKNPNLKGREPFASDFYGEIVNDCHTPIRLMSDDQLSDDGYKIWVRLFRSGHKVSVYDPNNPGQSAKHFKSEDEMSRWFAHWDPSYKKYQYIISENIEMLGEVLSLFNLRRYREIAGLALND